MKSNTKTLIILSPGFAADEADSACLPAQQLFVKSLNEQYPELNIIVLAFQYPFKKANYTLHGATVISFNGQSKNKLHRLKIWMAVWRQLKTIKKQHAIIGLLSFWCTECALVGQRFSKRNHLPHYIWLLGQDAREGNVYVKRIKPEATELIAMSDFLKNEFYRNYGILPAHIIYNGTEAAPSEITQVRDIGLLAAGSLIPLKQYGIFISIAAKLQRVQPRLNAVLCGKGPDETVLKQRADKLKANIVFTGELPHENIQAMMRRSKVLLHTSSYEGFSTVCLEALYAGAHIISFCRPLNKEVKNWHIVTTEEEMEQKALEILTSDILYESVVVHTMADSAKEMMGLFGQ